MVLGLRFLELRNSPFLVRFSTIFTRLLYHLWLLLPTTLFWLHLLGPLAPLGRIVLLILAVVGLVALAMITLATIVVLVVEVVIGGGAHGLRICTHCGQDNHIVDRCWNLQGHPAAHQAVVPEANVVTIFAGEYQRFMVAQ